MKPDLCLVYCCVRCAIYICVHAAHAMPLSISCRTQEHWLLPLRMQVELAGMWGVLKSSLFVLQTGVPLKDVDAVLLVFGVILPFLAAINEGSGKFVDED